jgi:hypothetical protein
MPAPPEAKLMPPSTSLPYIDKERNGGGGVTPNFSAASTENVSSRGHIVLCRAAPIN